MCQWSSIIEKTSCKTLKRKEKKRKEKRKHHTMSTNSINGEANTDQESLIIPLLSPRRSLINSTSQVAIVGADVCPIESLDYE